MSYSIQFNSNRNLEWCAAISLIMYWAMVDIYYTIGCCWVIGRMSRRFVIDSHSLSANGKIKFEAYLKYIVIYKTYYPSVLSLSLLLSPMCLLLAIFFITHQSTSSTHLGFQDFGSLGSSHNSHAKYYCIF
jgi:hypothetical protein